ncbi:Kinetochore NDC80 [Chlorella sorokiniana]|uniref:Kinetochore NDC80 n=1 Tax=Chlorella sorokiniana TaxID=3076 RepID=A0A2P6THD9_CHLSO|nr:Kinetochore NDC80 [Chlorella sorokiniana]|eukprot:PRW33702.1 Kinetochore NDC80 [Chlorella sorokiniana]
MDRRKTLGALAPGQLNARQSLAPGAGGKAAGKLPLDKALSRMSLAGPVARRSSAYTTKASGVKQDPRPVSDKGFQQACIRTVITYLAAHSFEYAITPKVLASPTTKDFTNVMMFLFRQFDPVLPKTFKLEEEVPQLYKRLKYPFQISKSNLTAVGSPHTWPSLLAALTWLVELLNYAERAEQARQDVQDERSRTEAEFFQYVSQVYRFFMTGDDGKCEEVDGRQAAEFEARAAGIRNDIERLAASNDALRAEIERLRGEPSPLLAARTAKEETLADKEKFLKLLDNLQAHKTSLQRKLAERQADVAAQAAELAAVEKENEQLRARIAVQTVHPADVMRMNQEKAKLESALRSTQAQREGLDRRVLEQERGIEARLDSVEAALQGYHSMADRLALIPATAKRAEGVNFEVQPPLVRLDRGAASASEMINVDLKGIVKPALQRLRDSYSAKARELADQLLSLQEKHDSVRELLAEREEENRNAEAHVHKLDGQYRAAKEALEQDIAAAQSQVDLLAAEVAQLRNANGASVMASEERLRALQAQYEDLLGQCELDNATLHRDLSAALEKILNHKLQLQADLKALCGRESAVMQQLQQEAAKLAALAAERRRREEAESKLSRALENNTALARGNLRLQEQCARLRGEADLRQHDEGCQRAAAAAREQEVAAKLARLQALVRRGAEEREALQRQLAGKQEVIAYLEGKLAARAAAGGAAGSDSRGQLGASHSGAGEAAAGVKADGKAAQISGSAADSLEAAAPAPAGREPRQRVVPLVPSEEEEAQSVGEEASSGSPAELPPAGLQESGEAGGGAAAGSSRQGRGRKPPAEAELKQTWQPKMPSPPAAADKTPAPNKKQQQSDRSSAASAPPTILRTSLRARNGISYAEPSLHRKLRQGDPFTFGAAEAAAAGAGKSRGRARTKPRPRFAAGTAQHSGGERREALPPVSD